MKTPLACIGLGALAASAALAAYPSAAAAAAAACLTLSAALFALRIFYHHTDKRKDSSDDIVSVRLRRLRRAMMFLLGAAVMSAYFFCAAKYQKDIIREDFDGRQITFSGKITSSPYTSYRTTRFLVKTDTVDGEEKKLYLSVSTDIVPNGREGDIITGSAKLTAIEDGTGINYASYCAARKIYLYASIRSYEGLFCNVTAAEETTAEKLLANVKRNIGQFFERNLSSGEAELCTAMITGDKSELVYDIKDRFSLLGMSHLIVVSGFHLSIVSGVMLIIFKRLFSSRHIVYPAVLVSITAYALMTGFGFSVRRAYIMAVIVLITQYLNFSAEIFNSLGIAAIVILIFNPFAGGDVGMLWSFACTASIAEFSEPIGRFLDKRAGFKGTAASILAAVLSAWIGSLPFSLLFTGQLSLYTVIVNIAAQPVAGIIVICGMAAAILSAAGAQIPAALPLFIAGSGAKLLIYLAKLFSGFPLAYIGIDKIPFSIWLCISAAVFTVLYLFDPKRKYNTFAAAAIMAVFAIMLSVQLIKGANVAELILCDVGEGITAVLRIGDSAAVIGAGGEKSYYRSVTDELDKARHILCVIDPTGSGVFDYGRRIVGDYGVDRVITADTDSADVLYSWYEYEGGTAERFGGVKTVTIDDISVECRYTEEYSAEYIDIKGVTVLLYSGVSGAVPEEFRDPDIAVVTTDAPFDMLSENARIIVSNFGKQYYDSRIIGATNGEGNIRLRFDDGMSIERSVNN